MRGVAAFLWVVLAVGCAAEPGVFEAPAAVRHVELSEGALPTIRFGADWSVEVQGELRRGSQVRVEYDPARLDDCRGTFYGREAWSILGYWRVDGGPVQHFLVGPADFAHMYSEPVLTLDATGELEMWFHNTSRWGCSAYDSNFGHNFRFEVAPPEDAPDWMGEEASAISRWTCDGGPCAGSVRPLEDGFLFDTAARQRATIAALYFQVWEPGVTDYDNPDLWRQLDVRMHYRFRTDGSWAWRWVGLDRRIGNDARYAVDLRRELDPLAGRTRTTAAECPDATLWLTPDGHYVETEAEYYFSVNGSELRAPSGQPFTGRFQDYVGLYGPCAIE